MSRRRETIADHQECITRVMLFIQDRLDNPPTLDEVAAVAAFSPYHFHRLFTAYTGESLSAFIRRLRLERAANRLRQTFDSITEIALNAGYETPANFGKAFRQQFGQSPSEFRERNHLLQTAVFQKRANLQLNAVLPKIITLKPQHVLFVRKTGVYAEAAAAAFRVLLAFAYSNRLMKKETQTIGISHDSPDITDATKLRYDACITIDELLPPQGELNVQAIAGGRYAIFTHNGPYEKFDESYALIFSQWLPQSGERLRDAPIFERYLNRDPRRTRPENLRTALCVPLKQ